MNPITKIVFIFAVFLVFMIAKSVVGAVVCVIALAAYLIRLFLNPFNLKTRTLK